MKSPVKFSKTLCACGCGAFTPIATRSDARRNQHKGEPMRFLSGHNAGTGGAILFSEEITQDDIAQMRLWDEVTAAKKFDTRIRQLERQHKRTFVETGLILIEMQDRNLWRELVDGDTGNFFQSFERWLMSAAPVSRSSAYSSMRALREITDVPVADLQEMARCNVITLQRLSPKVRQDPKVIEAAKTQTEDQFNQMLEEKHPDQHIESKQKMDLKPTKSARGVIDRAIGIAMVVDECSTREEAMECICQSYVDDNSDRYEAMRGGKNVPIEQADNGGNGRADETLVH